MTILFLGIILALSCQKAEDSQPMAPISVVPSIELEKMSPTTVSQFESVTLEISYIDGDGDIGTEDADDHALEIIDNRDNILHTFHIPPQGPSGDLIISGVLVVEIKNIILLDQSKTSEDLTFNIRLKDREGNWSKVVTSDNLKVIK